MAMKRRPIELKFHVDEHEYEIIRKKMEMMGITCTAAYLRRMALNGYILHLDLPELSSYGTKLRTVSSNFNQIAKRVNSTGRFYEEDMTSMRELLENLWAAMSALLEKLASLK